MRITISGKNIDITEGLRSAVEEKLSRLEKYFTPDTIVNVTLSVTKKRFQKMEVTIPVKGHIIRAEQESDDMYVTIDLVEEVIETQLKRYRQKLVSQQQNVESFKKEFVEAEDVEEQPVEIIRSKKFGMKPMFPEDACVQMELLGHAFYVFRSAESDEVNVVYKRKDGNYGLIEPEA